VNFFEPLNEANAAMNLKVSNDVMMDPANIATAYKKGAAGDNRLVLEIADLQDKKAFDGGRSNFTERAAGILGTIGIEVKNVNEQMNTQQGLVSQLQTAQEMMSGVSLDEEAINMMKFQKAFDASAKLIQVADNLMDTVLSLKRF
jgi:flagellar hook-associated protein 1 FlgK